MSRNILLVDDQETVHLKMKEILASMENPPDLTSVYNGVEFRGHLNTSNDYKLIFLDQNMPSLSGLDALEEINRSGTLDPHSIVIMLTTENSKALKMRGKELGVKGWLVKPFTRDWIVEIIQKLRT